MGRHDHQSPGRGPLIRPTHQKARNSLRAVGLLVAIIGALFALVGFVDFFSAFGGGGFPDKFWCVFVGLPLLAVGMSMLKFGFLGSILRYQAGEMAPVGKDTVNYMAEGTRGAVHTVGAALAGGLREGFAGEGAAEVIHCVSCDAVNDAGSRFCDQCGAGISTERACVACGATNEADAKFCDQCGAEFAPPGQVG